MHTSIPLDVPCEFINVTSLNPLISKCQIKVCYVGDQPNRNKSIITKDVARQMANSLPGSPIVGYYNEADGDFEEHNREITISGGKFTIKDSTRPYGFVDLGARCWFQTFKDDGQFEREYLMTEGYLWTGQYPEVQRVINKGDNQSMELDEDRLNAEWTKDNKGQPQFFIINEAIISKLCILGEKFEPCFEGANITSCQFSFNEEFENKISSMKDELNQLLNKGGTQVFTTYSVEIGDSLWNAIYSFVNEKEYDSIDAVLTDNERNFAVIKDKAGKFYSLDFTVEEDGCIKFAENVVAMEDYASAETPQFDAAAVEAFVTEFKCGGGASSDKKKKKKFAKDCGDKKGSKDDEDEDDSEDDDSKNDDPEDKNDKDDKKKKKYILEEIPEYTELNQKYSDLESRYNALVAEKDALETEIKPLREFKLEADKVKKQDMINNQFFMLSDEDKKDVVDNIDKYSLDEIEAKLSVICVRNKVSFAALDDEDTTKKNPTTYNLDNLGTPDDAVPAWVKAVLEKAKTL